MIDKMENSYLFMTCAREAISIYLDSMPLSEMKRFMISNYFLNEATDYEVLYILVDNDLPDKSCDYIDEIRCIDYINEHLKKNEYIFTSNNVNFEEIISLREWNISSQPTVTKFILDNHLINKQRKIFHREKSFLKEDLDNRESSLSELIMLSALLYASYKAYKARWNRLYSKCEKLKGEERTSCIRRAKISSFKTHLNRLRSSYPMCRGTRNPNKCRISIKKKIKSISNKINTLEEKLDKEPK